MRLAVFPGSFDPLTNGHVALVHRGLALFDRVVVAIGHNPNKQRALSLESRLSIIGSVFADFPSVKVADYEGLTVRYAESIGATAIIRGLRDAADFGFEVPQAQANRKMVPAVDTVFLPGEPEFSFVSSSLMREIVASGGDASLWLPKASLEALISARSNPRG